VLADFPVVDTPWGRVVDLGPLHSGQPRDVVVPLKIPALAHGAESASYLTATLTSAHGGDGAQISHATLACSQRGKSAGAVVGVLRARAVSVARQCVEEGERGNGQKACKLMEKLVGQFGAEPEVEGLKGDVAGRMSKALRGQARFKRWGRHYLRAILRAHQLQVCTNFMDGGVQAYGGALFRALRSQGDAAFLALPPPVHAPTRPDRNRSFSSSSSSSSAAVPAPAAGPDMASYYAGAGGGCFGPDSTVRRLLAAAARSESEPASEGAERSEEVRIADVRVGDKLQVSGGWSEVRCVVQVTRRASKPMLQLSSGLRITPGHPVRVGGRWLQPRALAAAAESPGVHTVYNVLLASDHVLLVGGVECITWGHRFTQPELAHAFFGSERVERALASMDGFEQGVVRVGGCVRAGTDEHAPVVQLIAANAPSAPPSPHGAIGAVHGA